MTEDAASKANALVDEVRKATVGAVAQTLSAFDRVRRAVEETECADEPGGRLRTVPAPSTSKLLEFVGHVAHLGLEQVNGLLDLHARYADDFFKWWTDYLWPKQVPSAPAPQFVRVRAKPNQRIEEIAIVTNPRSCKAKLTAGTPTLRATDGTPIERWNVAVHPREIELESQQPWPFRIEMYMEQDGRALTPGRYVGAAELGIEDLVVHRLLIDVEVTSEGGT